MNPPNLTPYLNFATDLAHQAGAVMLQHFQLGVPSTLKADKSPVTIADTRINQMVIDAVQSAYPQHAILGEEASSQTTDAEYVWVCDPLNGTIPYTLGLPINTFSLALTHRGRPVLGVLYDPYLKRLFHATIHTGAYMNEQPLHVNDETTLEGSRVALSGWQTPAIDTASLISDAITQGARIITLICVTYEASLIAAGQLAGNIFPYSSPWDIAALKVIVEAAGGKVTDLQGKEQRYDRPINGAIISNGRLHQTLVDLARPHLHQEKP